MPALLVPTPSGARDEAIWVWKNNKVDHELTATAGVAERTPTWPVRASSASRTNGNRLNPRAAVCVLVHSRPPVIVLIWFGRALLLLLVLITLCKQRRVV